VDCLICQLQLKNSISHSTGSHYEFTGCCSGIDFGGIGSCDLELTTKILI